jgi:protein SCO1/2
MPSFIIIAIIAFVLRSPALAHDEDRQKALLQSVTIEERLNHQLPLDLALRDETGSTVSLRGYFNGKPVLLAFVYYDCPQLCPLVLEGLGRSLRVLRLAGEDYQVVAVSIDPAETAALAARKKTAIHGAASWHFLTASVETIEALTQAAGFRYRPSQSAGKASFIHAANTLVLTPEGRISRYFSTIDFPPKELRFALIEASGNRIGSPLDHLLLLCYRYDPAQGRYTLAILNILRLSALITVAAVGGFIAMMLLRERRNPV